MSEGTEPGRISGNGRDQKEVKERREKLLCCISSIATISYLRLDIL